MSSPNYSSVSSGCLLLTTPPCPPHVCFRVSCRCLQDVFSSLLLRALLRPLSFSFLSCIFSKSLSVSPADLSPPTSTSSRQRFVRKDGSGDVVFRHVPAEWMLLVTDIFTTLVEIRWRVMFLLFALSYILSWMFFGLLFWVIAIAHGDVQNPSLSRVCTRSGASPPRFCFLWRRRPPSGKTQGQGRRVKGVFRWFSLQNCVPGAEAGFVPRASRRRHWTLHSPPKFVFMRHRDLRRRWTRYGFHGMTENCRVYGFRGMTENCRVYGFRGMTENCRVYGFRGMTENCRVYGFRGMTENCMSAIVVVTVQDVMSCFIDTFVIGIVVAKMASARKRAQTVGFSHCAVVNLRNGALCLSWRVGDFRRHHLVEGTARAQIVRSTAHSTGKVDVRYQDLSLQQTNVILATPTLLTHRIDADSPLYHMTLSKLRQDDFELVVSFTYTDDTTGILHQTRTSYTPNDIHWGSCSRR
ncbi:hypothetical protein WMY93_033130 [Mugilogobius chulae]|uniref:Uncharacterized protein n=1 Tax=Mugilogobius chulae TaxID=88201 RepID=A0AAW0MHX8_9GOBI